MKAVVDDQVVAQSNDVIDCKGYQYFPQGAVRMDWLQKTAKTAGDLKCPHGVQFYDVVVDGKRPARAAWSSEAPRPEIAAVGGRSGSWQGAAVAEPEIRTTYAAAFLRLASSRASTSAAWASITGWLKPFCRAMSW